ncbi:hypothetical protein PQE68_gp025 [Bacillus phage vB_BanS_Sophrita]|uniref:Uncharacterized protein n=1 Tax=Bacillus phage vB_BanS_Sophrita TaxID=2894790 RepID=A0AAE8YTQ1_9CAUD|nr:hypothetical protein PQE68_gp025 [Bacillus phage vB_BanS_Sophrita]UGO50616.1 hypothetical protein SOPHRITA_25 [Bacillus phage vB_BanS_Sophrita]
MELTVLIEKLNHDLTAKFRGVKFTNMGLLHLEIVKLTDKILQEHETGLEINYNWDIHIKGEYHKVMKYNIEYTADKRYKYQTRGKVHFLTFEPLIEMPEDATVEDLINASLLKEAKYHYKRMQDEKIQMLEDLAKQNDGIDHWAKKINELESR